MGINLLKKCFKKSNEKSYLFISLKDCIACGYCAEACRRDVLSIYWESGSPCAVIEHPERCSGCGKCVQACVFSAIEIIKK
ncbi:4Fe-4S dicluster domain-containing protein [Dysgonomonas sp. 216]|uniref:4Fe-4S dicluster domain-containing protein n=1 Tax=Dysgonomonas sp. 216 TaxID=2302934 RepID=UPI0013CFA931|nr:4Fe-4S binding protein [Dysgonomonas sp. 216]NDW17723.1 4Fe-4S dicluster domain-containing protein [Dysgonomonas sp. 216]